MSVQGKKKIFDMECAYTAQAYTLAGAKSVCSCSARLRNVCIRTLVLQTRIATIETRACMNPSKHIDVHLRHIFPCRPPRAGMPA
jgi:hypothetical protein